LVIDCDEPDALMRLGLLLCAPSPAQKWGALYKRPSHWPFERECFADLFAQVPLPFEIKWAGREVLDAVAQVG
jgi:hypothetical protein